MNQKKAKAIRRMLRGNGVSPRDTAYKAIKHKVRDGISIQIVLSKDCGRSQYRNLKRVVRVIDQSGKGIKVSHLMVNHPRPAKG